ncbi:MAG: hypothetical protein MZV64_30095 [Ignavibacteriales bacterium]|nr:hypothetical protein [Ignavibacteriales bacterium]
MAAACFGGDHRGPARGGAGAQQRAHGAAAGAGDGAHRGDAGAPRHADRSVPSRSRWRRCSSSC